LGDISGGVDERVGGQVSYSQYASLLDAATLVIPNVRPTFPGSLTVWHDSGILTCRRSAR
jgi:hypothetical protein